MKTHKKIITTLAALVLIAGLATTAQAKDRRDDRNDRKAARPSRNAVVVKAPAVRNNVRRPQVVREVRRPAPVITGHWETRTVSVLVEAGHYETYRIAASYEIRFEYGRLILVCVQPEQFESVWIPARYEYRTESYWVEDRYDGRRY